MKTFISILKDITKFFFGIFAPLILIVLGGLLIGWAFPNEYTMLSWTGVVMVGAGIIWGIFLFAFYGPIDWS